MNVSMQLTLLLAALLASPTLPSDPRLSTVRADLSQVVDQTYQAGLPADMLVAKIQEGLAKNVPPARIVMVVRGLAADLTAAKTFAATVVKAPSPSLLRALVDAKAAGVQWKDTTALLKTNDSVKAIQVLTDLAARGYPTTHAAAVVQAVLTHDPQSLGKLSVDLDRVRRAHGFTQAEMLDDLSTALDKTSGVSAGSLDKALQKVDDGATGSPGNSAAAHDRGPNRDTSGHHGKGH
jgi:hypothetical protein